MLVCLIDPVGVSLKKQMATIETVLEMMGIQQKPRLNVFNKIDLLDQTELNMLKTDYPDSVFISARADYGLNDLRIKIAEIIGEHVYFK